jgi:hypothetical protein
MIHLKQIIISKSRSDVRVPLPLPIGERFDYADIVAAE